MSQRQFAKRCNLSNGYISMLINNVNPKTGKPLIPSLSALLSISKGMGITLDELINSIDDINVDISLVNDRPITSNSILKSLSSDELKLLFLYRNNLDIRLKIQAFLEVSGEPITPAPERTIKIAAYGGGITEHQFTATDEEIKDALLESDGDPLKINSEE